jgi:CelD/BcsL family acetyltransferase involved in cellulose biosynthesis
VTIHVVNPLSDNRWDDLVARHPKASVFHGRGWLEALSRTYGYEPLVLTSAPPGRPLSDGIVLCRVSSWITGTRLVSLPFADHCEPLVDDLGNSQEFMNWLRAECDRQRWKYVELRPLVSNENLKCRLPNGLSYCFHTLDLARALSEIFQGFHKDSVQRKIRRAEKAGLNYDAGRSERIIEEFYGLLLKTRRRHQLFPQPRVWFKNLFACLGENVQIRVARKEDVPIAAMLTLRHRSSVVYKYGCSDEKFHNLGGMQLLFWRLIEESKTFGAAELDFGRSDMDNEGLVTFKDRFGTKKKLLTYVRYPQAKKEAAAVRWGMRAARQMFSILPDTISPAAGKILYKHIG